MTDAPEAIRILLADDHAGFRSGLAALVGSTPGLEVTAEAATGEEAVALAATTQPDVVVMDLNMAVLDGIEATRRIVATSPHIAVLVLSMYESDDQVFGALKAGARGYLLKGADRAEIVRAIRGVASGEAIFGPGIARRLMAFFASRPAVEPTVFPELTDREREILDLVARGLSNAEITNRLVLSPKTVRNHVSNIFSKLQVADRAQAIVRAREAGMGGESRSSTAPPGGSRLPPGS
ncbi:MAG TPA: response regulator transcription factor [Candidatus Limnocylindrales bacterium]|nr:response regulator transcription factor [Candidatus Limnocylindrales bacterium]